MFLWGGQLFPLSTLSEEDTVLDLEHFLKSLTGVLPESMKLLGLKYRGKPAENLKLGVLKLKPKTKITMMGAWEESLEEVIGWPPNIDDVVNDFDIEEEVVEVKTEENVAKISCCVKDYKVEVLNPPREGNKLLIMDVDYTLFGKFTFVLSKLNLHSVTCCIILCVDLITHILTGATVLPDQLMGTSL
ncbi:ubiquitin-like domain-containing CTD phosphatase 1 [Xenopus laevis]|uniref:Ubiquitin-like domain-containing CTD phosphatase 1 n=1 Tax=Xenopus laevis TaxID=8355 RepID=A0A8J1MIZ1_XENLA|nr:ubiquitin-like domain-containing CTD phosphatase 1 [Xenopus laevis]